MKKEVILAVGEAVVTVIAAIAEEIIERKEGN